MWIPAFAGMTVVVVMDLMCLWFKKAPRLSKEGSGEAGGWFGFHKIEQG